jgi:hypothetical protein
MDKEKYIELLIKYLPKVLEDEGELSAAIYALECLEAKEDLAEEELLIANLLALLIEDYENTGGSLDEE